MGAGASCCLDSKEDGVNLCHPPPSSLPLPPPTAAAIAAVETSPPNPMESLTPFLEACSYGPESLAIERLCRGGPGARVDVRLAETGTTPLMSACANSYSRLAVLILKHPFVDVYAADKEGATALHFAAANGLTSVVERMLAVARGTIFGAEPLCNAVSLVGDTALHSAVDSGIYDIVELLICAAKESAEGGSGGADAWYLDAHARDDMGGTALVYACERNLEAIALAILRETRRRGERETAAGVVAPPPSASPLVLKPLLQSPLTSSFPSSSFYYDDRPTTFGNTALSWACWNGMEAVAAEILAQADAARRPVDVESGAPLIGACHSRIVDIAVELVKRGANLEDLTGHAEGDKTLAYLEGKVRQHHAAVEGEGDLGSN